MIIAGPQLDALQSAGAVPKSLRGAITYVAGTTGAIGATTLFTVTGDVLVTFLAAKCTTDLTSGGVPTWTLGVTGNTAVMHSGMPDVTGWDAGDWADGANAGYGAGGGVLLSSENASNVAGYGISANIVQTIASATITGGVVVWYLQYIPLSANGAVALHANLAAI